MTDKEIVKALECCIYDRIGCNKCPMFGDGSPNCWEAIRKNILELINRLQDEREALINGQETLQKTIVEQNEKIKRLKRLNQERLDEIYSLKIDNENTKAEAIKEFWASLKEIAYIPNLSLTGEYVVDVSDGDNLVKEMTESVNYGSSKTERK